MLINRIRHQISFANENDLYLNTVISDEVPYVRVRLQSNHRH